MPRRPGYTLAPLADAVWKPTPLARALAAHGRDFHARGWLPATSGNPPARLHDRVLITVSGRHKGRLTEDDFLEVDLDGRPLAPGRHPSAETLLHARLYAGDPGIGAMFHVHEPYGTLLSVRHPGGVRIAGWEILKAFPGITSHDTERGARLLRDRCGIDGPALSYDALGEREQRSPERMRQRVRSGVLACRRAPCAEEHAVPFHRGRDHAALSALSLGCVHLSAHPASFTLGREAEARAAVEAYPTPDPASRYHRILLRLRVGAPCGALLLESLGYSLDIATALLDGKGPTSHLDADAVEYLDATRDVWEGSPTALGELRRSLALPAVADWQAALAAARLNGGSTRQVWQRMGDVAAAIDAPPATEPPK